MTMTYAALRAMTYAALRAMPLADLAGLALDTRLPARARLDPREAVLARVHETGTGWAGFDHAERAAIRRAMRLDLSSLGFIA